MPDQRTLELAGGGCYHVDSTVRITDRAGLVLDGRGATLRAGTAGDQARRHLSVSGGRDVTVRDVTIRGSMPNTRLGPENYSEDRAFQHGIELRSVSGTTVEDVQVLDVFGAIAPDCSSSRITSSGTSRSGSSRTNCGS